MSLSQLADRDVVTTIPLEQFGFPANLVGLGQWHLERELHPQRVGWVMSTNLRVFMDVTSGAAVFLPGFPEEPLEPRAWEDIRLNVEPKSVRRVRGRVVNRRKGLFHSAFIDELSASG